MTRDSTGEIANARPHGAKTKLDDLRAAIDGSSGSPPPEMAVEYSAHLRTDQGRLISNILDYQTMMTGTSQVSDGRLLAPGFGGWGSTPVAASGGR